MTRPSTFLGFLTGNTKLDLEFRVNAFPDFELVQGFYKGRLTYEKKLLCSFQLQELF
jgi:hypothetical protein